MTLALVWTVEIGDLDTPTDFTDRVTGLGIRQSLRWMRPSLHAATITLNNFDGALTPAAGGGAGTYANVDWLSQGVFISATVNGSDTAEVFHGVVRRFELIDDGTSSTVILTVNDALTLVSRDQIPSMSTTTADSAAEAVQFVVGEPALADCLPRLGKTVARPAASVVTQEGSYSPVAYLSVDQGDATVPATAGDILATQVMPSNLSLLWCERIVQNAITANQVDYQMCVAGGSLNRTAVAGASYMDPRTFKLVESSPASGELTFTRLEMGYTSDDRYSASTVTSVATYTGQKTFSYTDSTLEDLYGLSRWQAVQTLNDTVASTQNQSEAVVNRFGPVVFTVESVELTTPNLADNPSGSSDELAALLDAANLWQRVDVEYTPTGAAGSTTVEGVIFGRQINVRPGRTSIVLDVVPASLFTTFTLNSSTLGVLDEDRLA